MPSELIVIVPSRGRPRAAREVVKAFEETCRAKTTLVFAVDEDDPTLPEYSELIKKCYRMDMPVRVNLCQGENKSHTMVEILNGVAKFFSEQSIADPVSAIGFMGDDHRPRTEGWDVAYIEELRRPGVGIVYGNDLLQGERLPTQCAMRRSIIEELGFMAPPVLKHMYVDNFWKDLGEATNCLRYLPDVVVEHMHPIAGKAEWDEGHKRVNDPSMFSADAAEYQKFKQLEMYNCCLRVNSILGAGQKMPYAQLGAFAPQPTTRGSYPQKVITDKGEQHEWRLFPEGTVPEYTTPEWYAGRKHAPHINEPVHRDRLQASATFVAQAAFQASLHTLVDLGCGDGGLLTLLGPKIQGWGYDLSRENVEASKLRGVDVRYGDALGPDVEWGDIAVATEMLEHLVDPHAFVRRIAEHSRYLVCSSPWDERPGKAYEFHTWAWDVLGYRQMVEANGWKVLRQRQVHRFQIILAVRA